MGSHGGMGSGPEFDYSSEDWGSESTPMCCPTKKIWGSKDYRKDGIYDLYMGDVTGSGMGGNGMGSHGSGMGGSHEFRQGSHGDMGGSGMGGHGDMGGSGMGGHGDMGYGGMGGNQGYGMGANQGYGMEWPERCGRNCVYTKRNSNDGKMFCFARSQYSQSQCVAHDGYGMGNNGYGMGGNGMGSHGHGMGGYGNDMGSHGNGMGSHGNGMGSGSGMGGHDNM